MKNISQSLIDQKSSLTFYGNIYGLKPLKNSQNLNSRIQSALGLRNQHINTNQNSTVKRTSQINIVTSSQDFINQTIRQNIQSDNSPSNQLYVAQNIQISQGSQGSQGQQSPHPQFQTQQFELQQANSLGQNIMISASNQQNTQNSQKKIFRLKSFSNLQFLNQQNNQKFLIIKKKIKNSQQMIKSVSQKTIFQNNDQDKNQIENKQKQQNNNLSPRIIVRNLTAKKKFKNLMLRTQTGMAFKTFNNSQSSNHKQSIDSIKSQSQYQEDINNFDYFGRGAPAKKKFLLKFYKPVETSVDCHYRNKSQSQTISPLVTSQIFPNIERNEDLKKDEKKKKNIEANLKKIFHLFKILTSLWDSNREANSEVQQIIPYNHCTEILKILSKMNIPSIYFLLKSEIKVARIGLQKQFLQCEDSEQIEGLSVKVLEVQKIIFKREQTICSLRQLEAEFEIKKQIGQKIGKNVEQAFVQEAAELISSIRNLSVNLVQKITEWRSYLLSLNYILTIKNQKKLKKTIDKMIKGEDVLSQLEQDIPKPGKVQIDQRQIKGIMNCSFLTNDGQNQLIRIAKDTIDLYRLSSLSNYFNFLQPTFLKAIDPFLIESSIQKLKIKSDKIEKSVKNAKICIPITQSELEQVYSCEESVLAELGKKESDKEVIKKEYQKAKRQFLEWLNVRAAISDVKLSVQEDDYNLNTDINILADFDDHI